MAHPLDPLSAEEISLAAEACKAYAEKAGVGPLRFNSIALQEPKKADLLAFDAGAAPAPPRAAACVLHAPPRRGSIEALVALPSGKVADWKHLEGVEPLASPDDCLEAEAVARADPEVQRLLRERYDVGDLDLVQFDPCGFDCV
ncbi:MAG: copper amine oxidase [Monoraphidium minutum]|nr:MAG: copper amine oxidase [Monoraphidium minutum]